jgi:hypothetical protein
MPPEGSDLIFDHRHNAEMSKSSYRAGQTILPTGSQPQ